jgi:hypothetical protein
VAPLALLAAVPAVLEARHHLVRCFRQWAVKALSGALLALFRFFRLVRQGLPLPQLGISLMRRVCQEATLSR